MKPSQCSERISDGRRRAIQDVNAMAAMTDKPEAMANDMKENAGMVLMDGLTTGKVRHECSDLT